jgi:hypothetical protein
MKLSYSRLSLSVAAAILIATASAAPKSETGFNWATVVNNNVLMPPLEVRKFNSYNQPSVNKDGLVVIRARSRGGPPLGQPTHGIYTRDMSVEGSIVSIFDKTTRVPHPNNLEATFVETPSFPRVDQDSDTIATRANHRPVRKYLLDDGSETRVGTTGIYTNPYGNLITGAAKLGHVPGFRFYSVPEFSDTAFEVFPGAPSVTNGNTIVFKGNYTAGGIGKTGVYYRVLEDQPAGGTSQVVMIANNTDTLIPGTTTVFGSTAPPNAADGKVVFAGFDDEHAPTLGGIYMARLEYQPRLTTLVRIGGPVPGNADKKKGEDTFNRLAEGTSFDGRFVGFWGAWGNETKTVRLYCQKEGNKDRIAYCNQQLVCRDTGETRGDPQSICDDVNDPRFGSSCYQDAQVPVHQGVFVHDTMTGKTHVAAKAGPQFDEFLFWNYSGKTPCTGGGHSEEGGGEDDAESVRWRSSAFVAVSARRGSSYNVAFKARTSELIGGTYVDPIDGIFLRKGPGKSGVVTVLDTTMDGLDIDPEAPVGSTVIELGLEREGLRGDWLAINASMGIDGGEEEDGMAGIYVTKIK